METNHTTKHREPWNRGKLIGQQAPFKPKEIWAIRIRLQTDERIRELALFDLGIGTTSVWLWRRRAISVWALKRHSSRSELDLPARRQFR
jgi:hypothetical protein